MFTAPTFLTVLAALVVVPVPAADQQHKSSLKPTPRVDLGATVLPSGFVGDDIVAVVSCWSLDIRPCQYESIGKDDRTRAQRTIVCRGVVRPGAAVKETKR
jgi:hypothetical protein